ncbi:pseudouridine synthase [Gordonia sp. DT30]|uniref:pseudouridine synthase n=1 Tax=unclassified Gordonia (in: high G+C Gram-positive bacteria) TaxID=2657482 RepID=UPI003CF4A32B
MATAGRDGTPGRRKTAKNHTARNHTDKSAAGRNSAAKNAAGGGKPVGGKGAGKPTGKKTGTGSVPPHAQPHAKKKHRKGSSKPDVDAGRIRLNNARPARHQAPSSDDGDHGATYVADGVRLQKVLAQAGVASRRGAEELIAAARVEVDGEIVTEQGMRINPDSAVIRVDGARVIIDETRQYLALNKPKGWQSTMSDDQGRPCIGDIVAERVMSGQRLFHVGRLDADTEGLLLLTNDGELAHRLMHPSYEVPKTYLAWLRGEVPRSLVRTLRSGVELDDGPVAVDGFTINGVHEGESQVRITLHEGRNRIVRRMMEAVGFPVQALVRTHIGTVALGDQRPGSLRVLGRDEVGSLYKAVGL